MPRKGEAAFRPRRRSRNRIIFSFSRTRTKDEEDLECILTRFLKEWTDANGTGIWKMPEPAGWKPALRSAAILAAGSRGFQPRVLKNRVKMHRGFTDFQIELPKPVS
jgi:hypothetical protein